tara:strand:- start:100 stop:603 length:504 start_codon:yes stop_codon:yes gene_type:complete
MKIKLIVATSENNVIGIKNNLPWNLPDDMQYFKNMTMNSVVIMGKNNYLSIPEKFRPLKKRINIILTRKKNYFAKDCLMANSLEAAIELAKKQKLSNIFIIGGGMVYKHALDHNLIDIIYLTRIHAHIDGDIFFPKINLEKWKKTNEIFHKKDDNHKFSFTFFTYEK